MSSFFELDLESHLGTDSQLMKLSQLLDWDRFRFLLKDVHTDMGPTGYDIVQMFKCMLLQSWHSLSDPSLEHSLRVRLDFLQFTGFNVGDKLPDETTFCRFRNKLVSQGRYEILLKEVNHQLETYGLKVKHASIAIVDATIIDSSSRPRKVVNLSDDNSIDIEYSSDSDARWKKKGKKNYFGYQGFARCDEEGFIDKTHTTPANTSELHELDIMTDELQSGTRVNADKGFVSKSNRLLLKDKKLKNGLMYKSFRNKPLNKRMRQFNKIVSQSRWRIEQCFGTLKRRFNFQRACYFGTQKVQSQFTMKAICMKLLKAINKVQFN